MRDVSADRLEQFGRIDTGEHETEGALAGHCYAPDVAAASEPETGELRLAQIPGPLGDRGEPVRVARDRARRQREHRGKRVAPFEA